MNKLDDPFPFKFFVKEIKSKWVESSPYTSCFKTNTVYSIHFSDGEFTEKLPKSSLHQYFEEDFLRPISEELGIGLRRTAKLLALENAWINLVEKELSNASFEDISLQLTREVLVDYLVLSSSKWMLHPWIEEQINLPNKEDLSTTVPYSQEEAERNYEYWLAEHEYKMRDINFCIQLHERETNKFFSILEANADYARYDIDRAKNKIKALKKEMEEPERVIREANKIINKFKKSKKIDKKNGPEFIDLCVSVKKFAADWVGSLMNILYITSCSELATETGGKPMVWWRRLNQKTLSSASTLEKLLDTRIERGKYKGTKLCDIPTTPSLPDLVTLAKLV
jgi:hypothetical protein